MSRLTPKEIRTKRGLPRRKVMALADVSEGSVRTYEADPDAVSPLVRAKLDPVYRDLARGLT